MKRKAFPISMAFLWGMVFSQAMHSITLGLCMGLLMGITFGLFDSDKVGKEDEYKNFKMDRYGIGSEMSAVIHYQRLNADNFTGHSLDDFVRHQTVAECWRKTGSDWELVPNVYEENWSQAQCREIAEDMARHINLDLTGFGAFDGERIIGFATVSHRIFGAAVRYAQLVCFQISEEYRRRGIGRKLFSLVCEEARRLGADKLYISAHSSKESQAAYRALGCTPAEEVNEEPAAAEPFDVQMEYRL